MSPVNDGGRNAKKLKHTTMPWRAAVWTKASSAASTFSSIAPGSTMARDHAVQRPVRTKLMPRFCIAAKSASQTCGFGSKRNFRWTSDAMYVVPMTGNGLPSLRSQSRVTSSFGADAKSFSSFTTKPVRATRGLSGVAVPVARDSIVTWKRPGASLARMGTSAVRDSGVPASVTSAANTSRPPSSLTTTWARDDGSSPCRTTKRRWVTRICA